MLMVLLSQNESKTLEFKENTKSLQSIVKTIIAFANTAGGAIVIGVRDKTKEIIGLTHVLQEEERLANVIAESIEPLLVPDIQIQSYRNRELIIIQVPHVVGPVYLKSVGLTKGVYIRLGSTNRVADHEHILALQMLAKNISFDELPCIGSILSDLDENIIQSRLASKIGKITQNHYQSLGIITKHLNKPAVTNGGVLLFAKNRLKWFPDSVIRCVSFEGETRSEIIDQIDITSPLIVALDEILMFIKRHTKTEARIGELRREDVPQFPPKAIREAIINTVIHADYSLKGTSIQIAIFSNRIEITNPGALPYGQTLEFALAGISRLRNRMMGRIFREIKLIERLGTGLQRIMDVYKKVSAQQPIFEELNMNFRATLFNAEKKLLPSIKWQKELLDKLVEEELSTSAIAKFWTVSTRTARTRLNEMLSLGLIERISTSEKDPYAVFKVSKKSSNSFRGGI
jgi:ATP-dependent DNA helicase RecG